ncbi:MAG: LytR/AlgR family response regulator transcription factor [Thermonemataceae bacterium]
MRILILEDEAPAKRKLIGYLSDFLEVPFTQDSARTVVKGIELLHDDRYDLILADIKLLDGTSFEIFQKVETTTPIIFCTAYEEHLLEAFQTNGIAYVIKPYSRNDLESALKKFQGLFENITLNKEVLIQLQLALDMKNETYKKRFVIRKREGIKLLNTSEISLIQASGDFCKIVDRKGHLHMISKSIGMLEQQLNPKDFFRINRSQLVGIESIQKIEPYTKNRLVLKIEGVVEPVKTSSSATKAFRIWLES